MSTVIGGSQAPVTFPDWLALVVEVLTTGVPDLAPAVAYDGMTATPPANEGKFALFIGPHAKSRWTGANMCALIPTDGAPAILPGLSGPDHDHVAFAADQINIGVHVWGLEPEVSDSIQHDIDRYRHAWEIYTNVRRALFIVNTAKDVSGGLVAINGWWSDDMPGVLRYGELMMATYSVVAPHWHFPRVPISNDLQLVSDGQPTIVPPS